MCCDSSTRVECASPVPLPDGAHTTLSTSTQKTPSNSLRPAPGPNQRTWMTLSYAPGNSGAPSLSLLPSNSALDIKRLSLRCRTLPFLSAFVTSSTMVSSLLCATHLAGSYTT